MSTSVQDPTPSTADAPVVPVHTSERLRSWWHLPTALTALSVLALLVFALSSPGADSTTFRLATEGDLNPGGIVPEDLTLPSRILALVLALACLAIAGVLWWSAAMMRPLGRRGRPALVAAFGLLWVLAFLDWAFHGATVDVGAMLQTMMLLAVPLAFGALSGVLSERSGVINIAIEGQLLMGAFGAVLVGSMVGSPWVGLLAAPVMSLLIGVLLALFAVGYRVQQIIIGVVLNVFAIGLTSFFFGTVMKQNPQMFNQPLRLPTLRIPVLADLPVIGRVLFEQNILVYLMWIIVAVLTVALFRTRWGLRVRAVGEHPRAADTVGIDVNRTRWGNVLLGSAVAGLGGATLTIGTGVAFGEEMSAGKGYIALAAMILGRFPPVGALGAALLFAFTDALQLRLGTLPAGSGAGIPSQFLLMLPYIVTLFAVAGVVGRVRVPAANGVPYVKQ